MCTGTASGTAAALLACATGERRAGRQARISLRLPGEEPVTATAAEVGRLAAEVAARRRQLVEVLVAATGQPAEVIAHELDAGDVHDAPGALELGLIDRVVGPTDRAAPARP